jgi:hypothetical protein
MTTGDLGLVFGFVEEKSPFEGDVAVTNEDRRFFLALRRTSTAIHRDHARSFCKRAQIVRFQGFLKVEAGEVEPVSGTRRVRMGRGGGGVRAVRKFFREPVFRLPVFRRN